MKLAFLLGILSAPPMALASITIDDSNTDSPVLINYTWSEDFESGTISGWSSYPPFEDTAFDFTILPGSSRPANQLRGYIGSGEYFYASDLAPPDTTDNEYYILRSYRPNSAMMQKVGITKKLTLWGLSDSKLRFDYWLRYPSDADGTLRIHLAGADGRRYLAPIEYPDRAQWNKASLDLSEFKSSEGRSYEPGTEIEAIALVLETNRSAPSAYMFVAIDNIQINGQRQAGFKLISPSVDSAKNWSLQFAKRHIHPGEELNLEVKAEANLREATMTILNIEGDSLSSAIPFRRQGEHWVSQTPYSFPEQPYGPVKLQIEGRDKQNRIARTEIRLWNLAEPRQRRPRVFLSDGDRQRILDRISREQRYANIWEDIVERAKQGRENPFPEQVTFGKWNTDYLFDTSGKWFGEMGRSRVEQIFDNALVWFFDKDPGARNFVIESMLRMAQWDQWIHPWFTGQGRESYYPLGHAVMSIGIAYDLLYEELTEEQRSTIRQGVMKNGIIPTWKEYFKDNRVPNNTSNWISMAAGGSLVGLMAFYDELEQDGWDEDGEPWFSGLAEKMLALSQETMLDDGSYGEGIGYQHITYSHAQDMLAALDHQFGVKNLADLLNYTKGHLYWTYIITNQNHDALVMGDSNPRRGALNFWSWFAKESDDPVMKWFYAQRPGSDWEALLWDEPNVLEQGAPPEEHLSTSRVFPDKGNVVFRTGWNDDDAVLVYRAGPRFNHTHFDQGHFLFYHQNNRLVTEPDQGGYYSNPYYWSYDIQASGHNTILVDDNPESQHGGDYNNEVKAFDGYAQITDALVTDAGGFVVSELAPVYYADLKSLTRRLWFIDPGYIIVEDRIKSAGTPHTYQWQLYPPDLGSLEILNERALIRQDEAELQIHVLAPEKYRMKSKRYPIEDDDISIEPPLPLNGALQVTHDEKLQEQTFRVVLSPFKAGAEGLETITKIEGSHYQGAEFRFSNGRVDRIYFTDGNMEDEIVTDAKSAFLSLDTQGNLRAATIEEATHFEFGKRFSMKAEQPIHLGVHTIGNGERVRLSTKMMDESSRIKAILTTSTKGQVSVRIPERESDQVEESSIDNNQTVVDFVLYDGPLEIDIVE